MNRKRSKTLNQQYKVAEQLLPWNAKDAVLNAEPHAQKLDGSHFFYGLEKRTEDGSVYTEWERVSTDDGVEEPLFDHEDLCSKLGKERLTFRTCKVKDGVLSFTQDRKSYCYDLSSGELSENKQKDNGTVSPDRSKEVFLRRNNLWLRKKDTGEEIQLTKDGRKNDTYGIFPQCIGYITAIRSKMPIFPDVLWSPDSRYFLAYRLNQRKVKDLYLLESFDSADRESIRPVLHSYKCAFPEDEHIPTGYWCLFDTESFTFKMLDIDPQPAGVPLLYSVYKHARWLEDSSAVFSTYVSRGNKSASFITVKNDGTVNKVLTETDDTFINICTFGELDGFGDYSASNFLSKDGTSVFWQSERDDLARLFRYDAVSGDLLYPVTPADCRVGELISIDDENEWIYFYANDLSCASDPYYQLVCRVHFDGSCFSVLTPEDGMHRCEIINGMIVDTWSRVDKPPVTNLRKADGTLVRELVSADITDLMARGYIVPERFTVTASDGKTTLYGILIRPADFDPDRKYPFVDYDYGGMQCINVPKSFSWKGALPGREMLSCLETLAQLGIAGITIDGLGTPGREKSLHNISYENIHGCAGLKDHVYCLDELVEKYPFLDRDRIGIWGNSGGGCGSVRAILEYPDVYKVAVASAGNHDQRMYDYMWTETYYGLYNKDIYLKGDNTALAKNLKGKLLIVHGAMDDNVPLSQSIRLVDALIRADKDFDFFILPRCNHYVPTDPYFIQRKTDYFVEHLLGKKPTYRFSKP